MNSPNVGRGLLDAELQQETEKISPQLTGGQQWLHIHKLKYLKGAFSAALFVFVVCSTNAGKYRKQQTLLLEDLETKLHFRSPLHLFITCESGLKA